MKQIIILITIGVALVMAVQAVKHFLSLASDCDKYLYTTVGYIFGIYVEKFREPIISAVIRKKPEVDHE